MVKSSELLPARKRAAAHLGRVLVMGLGKSGRAAIDYLAPQLGSRVDELFVAAGPSNEAARAVEERFAPMGVRFSFDTEEIDGKFDLCIASPGISRFSAFYRNAQAASAQLVSEVEFAWRESAKDSQWVAVTGTNGKTTVTSLIAYLLKNAGWDAQAVGNIGDVCLEAVSQHPSRYYVVEASSFQLASTADFAPQVAVMLNITPDHISWHRTMCDYIESKYRVFANMGTLDGAVAVLDAENDIVGLKLRELAGQGAQCGFGLLPFAAGADGAACIAGYETDGGAAFGGMRAFVDEGALRVDYRGQQHRLCAVSDLKIKGIHNVSNALAAAAACVALGVPDQDLRAGLAAFAPLEHRIEPCGSVGGVECYNDSKATNVDATLVALPSLAPKRPVVLLGGRDKGTDLTPLVESARAHAKAVVCFGEAAQRFLDAFGYGSADEESALLVARAEHLEDAFDAALELAGPDDAILLSPACASFDEFTCFEERGCVFKSLVADRAERASLAERP